MVISKSWRNSSMIVLSRYRLYYRQILKNSQLFGISSYFLLKTDITLTFFSYLCAKQNLKQMANRDLNRLKVVLVEKKRTNKWLAEQLGKDQGTISKWCTNTCQPDLGNLMKISELLDVDLKELVRFEALSQN